MAPLTEARRLLLDAALAGVPRALGLQDRLELSPTNGSFDRAWWHYRVDKGYASATLQQLVWPLASLQAWHDPANPYHGSARLEAAARAGLAAWARQRNRDGSHSEWYRGERSHVATAFGAFGAARALDLLPAAERWPERADVEAALGAAGDWLTLHRDSRVANHAAGAIAALCELELLFPRRYGAALEEQIDALAALASGEGWLPEYSGADPGYASVALGLLAAAAERRPDDARLIALCDGLVRFISAVVGPDGLLGGACGRRGVRYAWLSGVALRATRDPAAAALLARLASGLLARTLPLPSDFDDRYFAFFALPDAVAALSAWPIGADQLRAAPPPPPSTLTILSEAGLAVLRSQDLTVIASAALAGGVQCWWRGQLVFENAGYVALGPDGERWASERLIAVEARRLTRRGDAGFELMLAGNFRRADRSRPYERWGPLLDAGTRIVDRLPARWARAAGEALKSRQVAAASDAPMRLERRISADARGVSIHDELSATSTPRELWLAREPGTTHVPSARLWLASWEPLLSPPRQDLAPRLHQGATLRVSLRLEVDDEPSLVVSYDP